MIFGGGVGHDLYISNDCNVKNNSKSFLGYNYKMPNGIKKLLDAKNYLAWSF